jgi:hypothetical protein
MEFSKCPKLRFLHIESALSAAKLEALRRLATDVLRASLLPSQPGSLKVRPDGTVLDGHHRLSVLLERGENTDGLPREIIVKDAATDGSEPLNNEP